MKKFSVVLSLFAMVLMAACGGETDNKKVVIMSSGKIQIDKETKTITLEPGNQHNEEEMVFGGDKATVTVKSPEGDKTYDIAENGTFLLNLKTDTLIGGIVSYGKSGVGGSITQEDLQHIIDSTQLMLTGQNASDANRSYFLPPYAMKKISGDINTKVIGPYNGIPGSIAMGPDGKAPEMFKFATNNQKRKDLKDLIDRLAE